MAYISALSIMEFSAAKAKSALHKKADFALKKATEAWVRSAESSIPVWSGMSRGTLVDLAGKVGINVSIFPASGAPDRVSEGQAQTKSYLISKPGIYTFFYQSNVFHLNINENVNVHNLHPRLKNIKNPGPYHFRQKADKAFLDTFRKELLGLMRFVYDRGLKVTQTRSG